MRDHEPAAVEHVVADQPVQEGGHPGLEVGRLGGQLGQGLLKTMSALYGPAAQRAQQLVLVVAGHADGVPGRDHAHDEPQHPGRVRPAVDEIADEGRGTALRVDRVDRAAALVADDRVAERGQQVFELRPAAVHVADHVERAGQVALVVVQPLVPDLGGVDLLAPQHVHRSEALTLQPPQAASQLAGSAG